MKIQCPNCRKITELEHVDHGSQVECVCSYVFTVDESTVTEEFTEVDSKLPEQIGQYPVTGFIGFGGMGKVYLAHHPNLGIPVAIKALRMEYMTDPASCERFVQSAKICARINHPNIVRVYDCGYENDNVYLVMEYVPNGSSLDLLEQEGKLEPDYAAFIMLEVCSGLMEAEKYGIVHRDLKPENIMFDSEGTVKILDLGLSKIIGDRRINKQSITASLTSLGTPLYMAPEQAVDAANCDSRADIYSIGVTLYQFCTGKLPFESNDPHELRRMHALEKPVPPSRLVPSLRLDMERIILRCMEKKREDRYASIAELALDLEAYLKNRVLPSTLQQRELTDQVITKRRLARQRVEFRRLLRVWRGPLAGVAAGLVILGALGTALGLLSHRPGIKAVPRTLTSAKVLSGLAGAAAVYAAESDFGSAARVYQDYRGPFEEETRAERIRYAEGYRLTQRQSVETLRMELAELLLDGKGAEAWKRYQEGKGELLCPECGSLLREFGEVPKVFRQYWQRRSGRYVQLSLNRRGPVGMQIIEARGFEVYAWENSSGKRISFTLTDLKLEEQLRFLEQQGISRESRDLWTGIYLLDHGKEKEAAALLKNSPVFRAEFERILAAENIIPAAASGSVRNQ